MKAPFSTINAVIAMSAGAIVLLGYFVPGMGILRDTVLHWAIILAAFALLVGVLNLLSVHWAKATTSGIKGLYSVTLIVAFLITVVLVGLTGPDGSWSQWLFNSVQIPVEAALVAMLAVTLAVASMRLLRRRADMLSVIFLATLLLVLLGAAPLYGMPEGTMFSGIRQWVVSVWAVAGLRGILIGVALGTIATGLRVLMGVDRPYGG